MKPIGAAILILTLAACSDDTTAPNLEPPGCYLLELGDWSGARESVDPPLAIRLLDDVGTDVLENGKTLARPVDPDDPAFQFFEWAWWDKPMDTQLVVVFTTGFTGIRLILTREATAWEGNAEAFTDVAPGVEATATARLSSASCDG